jgi:hypothetical protein
MAPGLYELPPGYSTTPIAIAMPFAGVLTLLRVRNNIPGTDAVTPVAYVVFINGVGTTLQCAPVSSATDGASTLQSVPFIATDIISIAVEPGGALVGTPAKNIIASIAFTSN